MVQFFHEFGAKYFCLSYRWVFLGLVTLLAKVVAGEAEVPFISCSASAFVELYVSMVVSLLKLKCLKCITGDGWV